jgi:sugar lactone lactonase YvrE
MSLFFVRTACLAAGLFAAGHASAQSEMLIVDLAGSKVVRFGSASSQFIDWFCVNHDGGLQTPQTAVYAQNGDLYVSTGISDRVRRFNGQTGQYLGDLITAGQGGLKNATDVVIGQDGRVYVGSYDNDSV